MSRLFDGFFQHGYLTTNLDRALAFHRDRLGIDNFFVFDTRDFNAPLALRVGLAWKDRAMIELIEPLGDPGPAYAGCLPAGEDVVRLHHLGYYTEDAAVFAAQLGAAESLGLPCVTKSLDTGFVDFAYYDARKMLGHHLEYVLAHPEGRAFLDQVPHN